MLSIPANAVRVPFKATLTAADRATFNKWLFGVSGFYACVAVLVICAAALGQVDHGESQQAAAKVTAATSSLAP
jgi:hypothetical protein